MTRPSLWDYARFTRRDGSHHKAFWSALDDALTPEQRVRLASGGDLRDIWEAQPAEASLTAPAGTDWLTPCRRIVREFEGCRLQAYPDPGTGGDPWTIGWGHTGPEVKPGLTWTQQQADAALDAELSRVRSAVVALLPMLPRWSGAQQAAITSLAYNIGTGALEASTLRRRLLAGEDPGTVVRQELPRWNRGGNGVMPGLTRRRAAELALFIGETATQQQPGRVQPSDPFTTRLSAHFTLGEFALGQEVRRFRHQYQVHTAAELCAFLERLRAAFGDQTVTITSGYRPPEINKSVGGASSSEHLYDAPDVGAVDICVNGADINAVQTWCDKEWPYSIGYGASKGFVHVGIRRGRPRVRWDY